eukprot:scaffold53036_cov63-Phaeocystis_antarctica.AAC.3
MLGRPAGCQRLAVAFPARPWSSHRSRAKNLVAQGRTMSRRLQPEGEAEGEAEGEGGFARLQRVDATW